MNTFVGTWVGPDEYTGEVEYTVSESSGTVMVTARDPSDGEQGEVSDVSMSAARLAFSARWPSTGRVAHCVLEVQGPSEAILTFTYTDHARLIRKPV
jgi:hypothetical protein